MTDSGRYDARTLRRTMERRLETSVDHWFDIGRFSRDGKSSDEEALRVEPSDDRWQPIESPTGSRADENEIRRLEPNARWSSGLEVARAVVASRVFGLASGMAGGDSPSGEALATAPCPEIPSNVGVQLRELTRRLLEVRAGRESGEARLEWAVERVVGELYRFETPEFVALQRLYRRDGN